MAFNGLDQHIAGLDLHRSLYLAGLSGKGDLLYLIRQPAKADREPAQIPSLLPRSRR